MSLTKSMARNLSNYDDKHSIGSRLRAKRSAPLLRMIEQLSKEKGSVDIIDIGGTETYWNIVSREFLEKNNVRITIVNLPDSELQKNHGPFRFVPGDGCDLSDVPTQSFDIAHSNSVIEHVGDWDRMVRFANELKRVARRYFIQTPNYWFPIEPHCMTPFFHWLPKPTRMWLVMHFSLGHWRQARSVDEAVRITESARLLNKKMFRELFREARIDTERLAFLPKSHIGIRD